MSLNFSARTWLFTAFLCILTLVSFAQRKNFYVNRTEPSWIVKLSPKAYKVNAKDVSDGYYMGLVEKQNHVELKEEYRHNIREIISQSGVQNGSEISVTYDPGFQKLTFHKIIVWRNNHPIDKLVASQFKILQNEKELSKFIYSGTFDAYLILDDVRKGDRIEYAYTIKGQNPIIGDKYTNTFYFEGSSSYGREYTNLIVSNKRKLNFKNFNFDQKPVSHDVGGMRVYEWESNLTKTHRSPDYEPSWYVAEKYTQVSEYDSWSDVVNWGLKVNSYPDLKTPLLDRTVGQLRTMAGNNQEKYIELATRFVQDEIRYMGIEMGEYSQRPNSPERVLAQRYGDCKDKSLLLIYLLERQDIAAYMAYVDTYSGKRTRDFLPSPFLFDHAVVVVEHKNAKTWIDPTISNQRGTFKTIYFPNYGQALVLKPGVDKPEDVISIPTGKLVADLNFIIPDTVAGHKATLIINSTYTDNYADDIRSTIEDQGTDGLEKTFREYIAKYYPDVENKGNIIIKDDAESNTINITESYLIDNIWLKPEKANSNRYIYFYGDLIDTELRTIKDKNRKEPLSLKYPVNVEENIVVQLPGAWNYDNQTTKVESDNYYFEFSTFSKGNILKFNYSYRNFKDHVEPADMDQYIKDSKKIANNLSTYIYYGGGGLSDNGNFNPYLIFLGIATVLFSAIYFWRQYHRKVQYDIQKVLYAPAIGGWLIVLAIGILTDPLTVLVAAVKDRVFNMPLESGYGATTQFILQAANVIKIICYSIQFTWGILITALFFKRRENLPHQYIRYMYMQAGLLLFLFGLQVFIQLTTHRTSFTASYVFSSVAGFAICLAWIAYFKKSDRVKRTFVFTYPELPWKLDRIKMTNALITGAFAREKEPTEL
jgi:hypothetical protein